MAGQQELPGYEHHRWDGPTWGICPPRAKIPVVIGLTEANATTALTTAGLVKGVVRGTTGNVIKASRYAGEFTYDNSVVDLWLAT